MYDLREEDFHENIPSERKRIIATITCHTNVCVLKCQSRTSTRCNREGNARLSQPKHWILNYNLWNKNGILNRYNSNFLAVLKCRDEWLRDTHPKTMHIACNSEWIHIERQVNSNMRCHTKCMDNGNERKLTLIVAKRCAFIVSFRVNCEHNFDYFALPSPSHCFVALYYVFVEAIRISSKIFVRYFTTFVRFIRN